MQTFRNQFDSNSFFRFVKMNFLTSLHKTTFWLLFLVLSDEICAFSPHGKLLNRHQPISTSHAHTETMALKLPFCYRNVAIFIHCIDCIRLNIGLYSNAAYSMSMKCQSELPSIMTYTNHFYSFLFSF